MKRLALAAILLGIALELLAVWYADAIAIFIHNARDGCYPWSPRVVPYHENMTLCPGQTAVVYVVVPVRRDKPSI